LLVEADKDFQAPPQHKNSTSVVGCWDFIAQSRSCDFPSQPTTEKSDCAAEKVVVTNTDCTNSPTRLSRQGSNEVSFHDIIAVFHYLS